MSAVLPNAQQKILLIDDDELIAGSLRKYLVVHAAALAVLTAYSSSALAQSAAECKVAALLNQPSRSSL